MAAWMTCTAAADSRRAPFALASAIAPPTEERGILPVGSRRPGGMSGRRRRGRPRLRASALRVDALERPGEGRGLARVVEAADPRDRALEAEPEARARVRAVAAKVEVPLVRRLRQALLGDTALHVGEVGGA